MNKIITDNLPGIKAICEKNHILYLGLFGSYARGEESDDSDVDFVVDLPPTLSLLDVVGIQLEFEDLLHKKIDLTERDTIKQRLKPFILNEIEEIYSK